MRGIASSCHHYAGSRSAPAGSYSRLQGVWSGGSPLQGGLLVAVTQSSIRPRSRITRSRLLLSWIAVMSMAVAMLPAVFDARPARAADIADFDPGYLISDYLFYNSDAMTQAEIQAFLESQGSPCAKDSTNCLDVFRQSTTTRAATARCAEYRGEANESAARIIFKVQAACGISAKALLVTLQKEQGLITSSAPSDRAIRVAMGYGCPDTAVCDSLFFGFFNQVYSAASQFQRYRMSPGSFKHQIGTQSIYLHPNSWVVSPPTCGTKSVTIKNAATAGLYNYTPYTPNTASLAKLYGTGDACSSYGNRNFWRYYTDWFGNPTGEMPSGVERSRYAGDTRYETSVEISKAAFPTGAPAVFVAVGSLYADGLAAAPAAARAGGPLLLTEPTSLPDAVSAEIRRLAPQSIVVVGGEGVVSRSVYQQLAELAPSIRRDAGADRFETARQIALASFPEGAPRVFIASGADFPDALSASAAAGALGGPVLLVPGGATSVDRPTLDALSTLGVTSIVVAGGPAAVSTAYLQSIRDRAGIGAITRYGGSDRFETAALINAFAFPNAERAYVASGLDFPDALSAAAVAGAQKAPLVLATPSCLPQVSVRSMVESRVSSVAFVGGTGVLGRDVYDFQEC